MMYFLLQKFDELNQKHMQSQVQERYQFYQYNCLSQQKQKTNFNNCQYPMIPLKGQSQQLLVQKHISKEDYGKIQPVESIKHLLQRLEYPSISQYCCECLQQISINIPLSCSQCLRAVHYQCSKNFIEQLNQTKNQKKCKNCRQAHLCWTCLKPIFMFQKKICCSICLRNIHMQCWKLPMKLFQVGMQQFQKIYNKLIDYNKTVCQRCQHRWSLSQLFHYQTVQGKNYTFLKVKHPSPIHYCWKITEELMQLQGAMLLEEEIVLMDRKVAIESILSVHMSEQLNRLPVHQIMTFIRQNNKIPVKTNVNFKFLVKWQNIQGLIWQQYDIVKPSYRLIQNFFKQLAINAIVGFKNNKKKLIGDFINRQIIDQSQQLQTKYLKNQAESSDNKKEDLVKKLHELYAKKQKQSIRTNGGDQPMQIDILTRLINKIYIQDKNPQPIIIFTEKAKIRWWNSQLSTSTPFHIILTLRGSQKYIKRIVERHLCSISNKRLLFRYNILLLQYQSLEIVLKCIKVNQLIEGSTLMIMDERMTNLARHFYNNAYISKIKLCSKFQESSTLNDLKNASNSSAYSTDNILKRELYQICQDYKTAERNKSQKRYQQSQKKIINISKPHMTRNELYVIWNKIQQSILTNQFDQNILLNQLQRIVVLRYIMAYGLNHDTSNNIYKKVICFQRTAFQDWDTNSASDNIYQYIKQLISVIWIWQRKLSVISKQILQAYFFNLKPAQIIKRIIAVNELKQHYIKIFHNSHKVINEDNNKDNLCGNDFDLNKIICQMVLQRGFGRWQSISQYTKVWEEGKTKMSFRQYCCNIANIKLNTESFSNFLKYRVTSILRTFKTTSPQKQK